MVWSGSGVMHPWWTFPSNTSYFRCRNYSFGEISHEKDVYERFDNDLGTLLFGLSFGVSGEGSSSRSRIQVG